MSAFNALLPDSNKLVRFINDHNWKIRVTSHLKKKRIWYVVALLVASSLWLSSLVILQSMDNVSSICVVTMNERKVIAAPTFRSSIGEPETTVNDSHLFYRHDKTM